MSPLPRLSPRISLDSARSRNLPMRRALLMLIVLLLFIYVLPLRAQNEYLEVDAVGRSYRLHVPRNLDSPAPLLIAMHGGGGTIARFQKPILIYPLDFSPHWYHLTKFANAILSADFYFARVVLGV